MRKAVRRENTGHFLFLGEDEFHFLKQNARIADAPRVLP
jgi:hypothetical protein